MANAKNGKDGSSQQNDEIIMEVADEQEDECNEKDVRQFYKEIRSKINGK
jgi:hypothetical protein